MAIVLPLLAVTRGMGAANLPPVQTYFVPLPEQQTQISLTGIDTRNQVGTVIDSVISIVATGNGTVVYYDHWEDGYELNMANPTQSTTQIWGDGNPANGNAASPSVCGTACAGDIINSGAVIALRNNVSLPRNSGTILYDGRDKVGSTQAVSVSRAEWAVEPGPVLAGAVEVLSVAKYGTTYEMPVGQKLSSNQMFEYSALFVMAGSDDTACTFKGAGFNLSAGQNYHKAGGVNAGDRLVCDKPVQAHLITGDVGSNYEARWFTLVPDAQWGSSYFAPVGTTATSNPADVWIYNPSDVSSIAVTVDTLSGSSSVTVGANSAVRVQMPVNSGAHLYTANGANFFAIGTVDSGQSSAANQSHDWGYSLVPESHLTQMAMVGWGPGSSDGTQNGSPIWVMATKATTLYIDYDGRDTTCPSSIDGTCYDVALSLSALQSRTVYDSSGDKDQTGMRLFTVDGTLITAAWGQDPAVANPGNPFLDMGTTVLPLPRAVLEKTAGLLSDNDGDGKVDPFVDTLVFTITLRNSGVVPVASVVVSDTFSANLTYVNGTAKMNGAALSDDFVGATRFPLDEGGIVINSLDVDESAVFVYSTTVGNTGQVNNSAQSTYSQKKISVQVDVPVDQGNLTACSVDFITALSGTSASAYLANGTVFVRLTDGDKNTTGSQDVVAVSVRNPSTNDRETVSLTETTGSSGVFEGSVPSSTTGGQSVEDGTLYALLSQSLSVSFTDTLYGDTCTDATPPTIVAPSQTKVLYLSEPGQGLDRMDPAATGDNTASTSALLGTGSGSATAQYIYALRGANTTNLWRYDLTGGSWLTSLSAPPGTIGLGSGMTIAGSTLYALEGKMNNGFYRYDINGNNWTTMANFPGSPDKAGALVYDGGNYIYTFDGGSIDFYRYNIATNTWSQRADYYDKFDAGGSLTTDGTYIYAFQGKGSNRFERYNPSSNSWSTMASAPGNINTGGALTFGGTYIYALQGAGTGFYRYNIASNSWTTLANTPGTVGQGGGLTFDGSNIYAFQGNNTTNFWRWNIASGTWTTSLTNAPGTVGGGGDLVAAVTSRAASSSSAIFTQTLPMASSFAMPVGGLITVTTYISATPSTNTVTSSISQSSDDAEQEGPEGVSPGTVHTSSSDIELVEDFDSPVYGTMTAGLRFNNINIPKGATITSAKITFRAIEPDYPNTNNNTANLLIKGQAADNPTTFTTALNNVSTRPRTTASTSWVPSTWTPGTSYDTPNLNTIVQELVNRSGWTANNSIAFIVTGSGSRSAESWDTGGSNKPRLTIQYTQNQIAANPAITATLRHNGTTFANLSNPTYNSSTGTLTWSGALGSNRTVTTGQAVSLTVTSGITVPFQILYDSGTYPSRVHLPTTTVISVDSLAV
ncbi:MAG: hypothetical protein WBO46_11505, partial [Caldilineaceae bacterium]